MTNANEIRSRLVQKAAENAEFRKGLLDSPKGTIEKELGAPLPEGIRITVLEEKQNEYYLVLPLNPETGQDQPLTDTQLESVAGGGCYLDCGCDEQIYPHPP